MHLYFASRHSFSYTMTRYRITYMYTYFILNLENLNVCNWSLEPINKTVCNSVFQIKYLTIVPLYFRDEVTLPYLMDFVFLNLSFLCIVHHCLCFCLFRLAAIVLCVHLFTVSDYHFGIFNSS